MASAPVLPKALKASIILFPGQGSQYVGMVKNLCPKGRSLFEMANQVLGYDLLSLCQNGPEADLNKTVHSQPAIFVSSLAAVERLAEMSIGAVEECKATAGFSVGEFASLVFAQSIDFVDALKLLKLRAEVTQRISETVPSGMMTVISGNDGKVKQACEMAREYCARSGMSIDESVCSISNHLFPHAKVIGGHQKALEFIELHGKDFGIKRMKRLAVSGAFHTAIMRPAYDDLKKALQKMPIKTPQIGVYSNITGDLYRDADQIRKSLARHVYMPVQWEQTMQKMYQDIRIDDELPVTFECGPQNNMTTMLGMVNLKAKKLSYNIEP
jgi:[acyl-carrier-protein] S-malonyltransferase